MISHLAAGYAAGSLSPAMEFETRFEHARTDAGKAGSAFAALFPDRAREEAIASKHRYADGVPLSPVDGIPIAWKDVFAVKGHANSAGLRRPIGLKAESDAELVRRASTRGMVVLGVTTMSEAGYSLLGENESLGWPQNPYGGDETPFLTGGSSSGSALAVASGTVPVAIGTDNGASCRLPAAWCGVAGLKPTAGALSSVGCLPFSPSVDSVGILARSARDVAVVFAALTANIPTGKADDRRIGDYELIIPSSQAWSFPSPRVATMFEAAIHRLRHSGAAIHSRHFPVVDAVMEQRRKHGSIAS